MHPVRQQNTDDQDNNRILLYVLKYTDDPDKRQKDMQKLMYDIKLFYEIKYMKDYSMLCKRRGIPFDGTYYTTKLNYDPPNNHNDRRCNEMKCIKEIFAQCAEKGIPFEENYYTTKYFETMQNKKRRKAKKEKDPEWKPSGYIKKIAKKEVPRKRLRATTEAQRKKQQ
jgi:hypothetical protein